MVCGILRPRRVRGYFFAFATIFFAVFALAPLLAKAPNQAHILWQLPVALTFINTGAYFLQAYVMFEGIDKLDMAWFALALAAVHIGLSRLVRRQQRGGKCRVAAIVASIAVRRLDHNRRSHTARWSLDHRGLAGRSRGTAVGRGPD